MHFQINSSLYLDDFQRTTDQASKNVTVDESRSKINC